MALWPFGKKQDTTVNGAGEQPDVTHPDEVQVDLVSTEVPADRAEGGADEGEEYGPFDGDTINIEDFDFSEFSLGILDLGSMRIPLPKNSQVQVEMGEQGPKMVHIVTEFGRITPVAFAAPTSAGQWAEASEQIVEGMSNDGLTVSRETGPWGTEIVGSGEHGRIRVIGVEGPRWMLRMTTTAPLDKADGLTELSREITARTFVYRGDEPILAGNSLPVVLPQQLVQQVQKAMEQRAEAQQTQQMQQEQQDAATQLSQLGKDQPPTNQ